MSSELNRASLRGPEEWEDWELRFKTQAIDLQLWDHITDNEELLIRPVRPQLASYEKQAQPRPRGRRSQTEDPEEEPLPSELTEQGRAGYQVDMQLYIQYEKEFKEQNRSVQQLRKWVMESVAPHFARVACKPEETLNQWYSNLKKHVGISDEKAMVIAYEKYKEALKPLTKSKDWSAWLMNWEKAMLMAEEKNVPEVFITPIWTKEFFKAVIPIAEHWALTCKMTHKTQIEKGLLTFRDIANDFREYMGTMRISSQKGIVPKVAKGAFGPTYAGQDTPDQGAAEDAQSDSAEVVAPTQRRRNKRPLDKHRTPEEEEMSSGITCVACGLFHPLSKCYYVFPDKAPNWFKENPEVRALVDEQLKENTSLREQIQKLKGKKPRTTRKPRPKPKQSQSQPEEEE